jgi:hypothetical protein
VPLLATVISEKGKSNAIYTAFCRLSAMFVGVKTFSPTLVVIYTMCEMNEMNDKN